MQQQCDEHRRHRLLRVDALPPASNHNSSGTPFHHQPPHRRVAGGGLWGESAEAPFGAAPSLPSLLAPPPPLPPPPPSPGVSLSAGPSHACGSGGGSGAVDRHIPSSGHPAHVHARHLSASFATSVALTSSTAPSPTCCSSTRSVREGTDAEEQADEQGLTLTLRPLRIVVVRGDTGRRCTFVLQPIFDYTWHRGNTFYESLDGEQTGVQLLEHVTCRVLGSTECDDHLERPLLTYAPSSPSSSGSGSAGGLYRNEESTGPYTPPTPSCDGGYSYEVAQHSRRRWPPACPSGVADGTSCLGSCTAGLLVDCLVKCVQDEAGVALDDRHGWVYLYHGRHIASELGRTRLLGDVLAHGYFDTAASHPCADAPSLTLCLFRKC